MSVFKRFFSSFFCLFFLLLSPTYAEKEIDLYDTSLLVINQTPEIRRRAAIDMLANVFVRLSGNRQVLKHPRVREAIADASKYVYEFSYQSTDQEITIAGTTYPASKLELKFSASPLQAILLEEKLPLWSERRPETLMWITTNYPSKSYVSEGSATSSALKLSANYRGLPLVMPILDLEDRNRLPASNIWALDERGILKASQRYNLDAVLAGRIAKTRTAYQGSFILNHQKKSFYFTVEGATEQDISDGIMDRVADYFASIYAFVDDDSKRGNPMQLVIKNARDFSIYAQLTRYLDGIKILNGAVLSNAVGEQLTFDIGFQGEPDRLLKIFALDKRLTYIDRSIVSEDVPIETPEVDKTNDQQAEFVQFEGDNPFAVTALPQQPQALETTQLIFNWLDR